IFCYDSGRLISGIDPRYEDTGPGRGGALEQVSAYHYTPDTIAAVRREIDYPTHAGIEGAVHDVVRSVYGGIASDIDLDADVIVVKGAVAHRGVDGSWLYAHSEPVRGEYGVIYHGPDDCGAVDAHHYQAESVARIGIGRISVDGPLVEGLL